MTQHALTRLKERGGIPKRAARRELERAREKAMPVAALHGRARAYYDGLMMQCGRRIVLADNDLALVVAADDNVVTVLIVPSEHRAQVRKQMARWKSARAKAVKA